MLWSQLQSHVEDEGSYDQGENVHDGKNLEVIYTFYFVADINTHNEAFAFPVYAYGITRRLCT